MQRFKVDTTTATFRVDGVEAKVDKDGRQITDKTGVGKYVVHLTVRDGGRAKPDQWSVTVLGEPKIAVDGYVQMRNVIALPWERDGKFGVALSAESIVPVNAPGSAKAAA